MTDNKDFDSIIHEITAGLSGDNDADIKYLEEKMEKYKDHEMSKEIIRACGRIIFKLLPDDKKEEIARIFGNNSSGLDASLEEVRFNIFNKNYDKANQIMEALVKKVEDMKAYEDDQVSEYHIFDELFEEVLYTYIYKPKKDIRPAQIPYTKIYMLYGSLLIDLDRLPDAQESLKKGLRWNPVSFSIMAEYIETYKMMGDLEQFFNLTVEAFDIAFHSKDVARCYRNLGYYFIEKQLWSEAIGCYILSFQFDSGSKQAQSELYYIDSVTNGKIKKPSIDKIKKYSKKYGFPIGANEDIIGLSVSYGRHFLEQNQYNAARYFLSIAYDLTDNPEIGKLIESLPENEE